MSVLLTDEAKRHAVRASDNYSRVIDAFVAFHATEGREALVDDVTTALAGSTNGPPRELAQWFAEVMVDRLFSRGGSDAR